MTGEYVMEPGRLSLHIILIISDCHIKVLLKVYVVWKNKNFSAYDKNTGISSVEGLAF